MKKWLVAGLAVLCVSAVATRITLANGGHDSKAALRAKLLGAYVVPPNNTEATGTFKARVQHDGTITFEVTYENLSGGLTQANIRFAQVNVNSNQAMIWLCGGTTQPPCPTAMSGSFEGTITPEDVAGPASQGINPGDLAAALRVIKDGEGYVNLQTTRFAGGEIRGQINGRNDNDQ
jgi:hypothetical protein